MHAHAFSPLHIFRTALLTVTLLSCAAPGWPGASQDAETYRRGIDDWHEKRLESLKNPQGYLSLAGLFQLSAGENRFGSATDNAIVFPEGTPAHAGAFVLEDGSVRIEVAEGVEITTEAGQPVTAMVLGSDADDETTVLAMGNLRFYVIDRSGDLYIRLKDLESDLLKHFDGIERFPVDAAWRIEARFEAYNPPRTIRVPNILGTDFEEQCPGRVVFEVDGQSCSLEPLQASGGRLFFVFGDETSGRETYGGGRFLVADAPADDGTVILDFNKAYNPPCAFSPFATCPLPHPANLLSVRIEAGEKTWGEGH